MYMAEKDMVTGAFSFTGKYLTRRLLAQGRQVHTLTNHPEHPHPFGSEVRAFPYHFDDYSALVRSLEGVSTFYISYWVRFLYRHVTHERAVENTQKLFRAAKEAGVRRVVYISISNPSESSPLSYFSGKARLEHALMDLGVSYAILRPTVLFGPEGILLNNIAWLIRRFPVFAVPGRGDYQLQPIFVEDLADLMVRVGQQQEPVLIDAVGPETYCFEDMVRLIAQKVQRKARIIHLPPGMMLIVSQMMSLVLGDVVLTGDEIKGLMDNLLISHDAPTAPTRLSEWLEAHASEIGQTYFSELRRHYR
jgi:nucleoside-diphosphate-sugar epimerase